MHGNNGMQKVEMFTFAKSSHDTNGTSPDSGQIPTLLINDRKGIKHSK